MANRGRREYRQVAFEEDDYDSDTPSDEEGGEGVDMLPPSRARDTKQVITHGLTSLLSDAKVLFFAVLLLLVGGILVADIAGRRSQKSDTSSSSLAAEPSPGPVVGGVNDMPTSASSAIAKEQASEAKPELESEPESEPEPEPVYEHEIEYIPIDEPEPQDLSEQDEIEAGDEFESVDEGFGEDDFECVGDRIDNQKPLEAGKFVCSQNFNFLFGITKEGSLVWKDVEKSEIFTYYRGNPDDSFYLQGDGTFTVHDAHNNPVWHKKPHHPVMYSHHCLPRYNCPFIYLHNKGYLTVDWMDTHGAWVTKDTDRFYDISEGN
mmetsp:Transcript_14945/g.20363  ORF Transcript_14945/g.20363 Transcript_14945/m.20363 type:complete len:320 (-) Transcript_14945:65-1024(-)